MGHDDHILALSYAELGRSQEAIAAADRASKTTQNPVILSQVAAAYALAGAKDKSRAMLPGIEGQARQRYVCGFNVACIYSVLGDKEKAFAWLSKAYRDRSDCWIPGSTRSEMIPASPTCFVASVSLRRDVFRPLGFGSHPFFLPRILPGHCFGPIPAPGSFAGSAFPVPPEQQQQQRRSLP